MSHEPFIDDEDLETGRKLFAGPVEFLRGVKHTDDLLPDDRREIAFAGRSNVGKSSLINALCNRHGLARASNTPGRTQELNYFDLGGLFYLVDMPGYGFAEAPKDKVDHWNRLIRRYLRGRANLRRVLLLIDARHGIKANDLDIFKMLDEAAVSYQLILTKADKPKAHELADVVAKTKVTMAKHPACLPWLITTSAEKGDGIAELRGAVASLLRQ